MTRIRRDKSKGHRDISRHTTPCTQGKQVCDEAEGKQFISLGCSFHSVLNQHPCRHMACWVPVTHHYAHINLQHHALHRSHKLRAVVRLVATCHGHLRLRSRVPHVPHVPRMDDGSFVNLRPPIKRPDARISTELAGVWGPAKGPRDTFKPHLYLYPSKYQSLPPSPSVQHIAERLKGPNIGLNRPKATILILMERPRHAQHEKPLMTV